MKRCAFRVQESCYRAPGQCLKKKNLKPIVFSGRTVLACAHHRAAHERGADVEVWNTALDAPCSPVVHSPREASARTGDRQGAKR